MITEKRDFGSRKVGLRFKSWIVQIQGAKTVGSRKKDKRMGAVDCYDSREKRVWK